MDNVELVTELRHELHAHPELSNHEVWTRRRLIDFLHAHTRNLEIIDEGKGYFYARYICHGSSETVAVRADFDALPIDEGIRMPWSSRNPGVSHKCGHDGHSASLAGLALEVDQKGADKNVVFIFQDAEEVGDGARVAREVIERERVDEVYAFHNWSRMEAGTVNVIDGPTMPASRGLAIAFHGKTSHAAEPENGINPAFAIAKVVDAVPGLTRPEDHKGYVMCTIVQVDVGSANFGVNAGEGRLLMTLRAQYEEEIDELQAALESLARALFDSTGYNEMSLTSLSSADYSCLSPLVDGLLAGTQGERVSFSLPSLRIDSFSVDIAERLQQVRKSGLTFAPEAGTQRLRDVINKNVTEDDLLHSVRTAFEQGWKAVKLYFMMGLPTETDEDIVGIAELAQKVVDCYKEVKGKRGVKVTVSVSCFVPKAYTPFQWFAQVPQEEFERRQRLLKESIRDRAISFHYHDARASVLEGALSRGDRRLSAVIETAWRNGAKFDGWTDQFKDEVWKDAFCRCGVAPEFYSRRTRDLEEVLPWAHTSPGVSEDFLRREWQRAQEAALTHDCRRETCTGCGVCPELGCDVVDWRGEA